MNTIKFLNTGSKSGFHAAMTTAVIAKFGEQPNRDRSSWSPSKDEYANKLLDVFVGVSCGGNVRLFLRAVIARELGNYLLTGKKTEGLYEKYRVIDKMYWQFGELDFIQRNRLLNS